MSTFTQGLHFPFWAIKSAKADTQTRHGQAKSPSRAVTPCQPCTRARTWPWAVLCPPWLLWAADSVVWRQSRLLSTLDLADFLSGLIQHHLMAVSGNFLFSIKRTHFQKIVSGFLFFFLFLIKSQECFVTLCVNKRHRKYNFTEIRVLHVGWGMHEQEVLQYWETNPGHFFFFYFLEAFTPLLTQLWWVNYGIHITITSQGLGLAENKVGISSLPHDFTWRSTNKV